MGWLRVGTAGATGDALVAVLVAAALGAASRAAAQEAASAPAALAWSLALDASETYSTNAELRSAVAEPDFETTLGASLARSLRSPEGELSLTLGGHAVLYAERSDRNRGDGALQLSAQRIVSPHTRLSTAGNLAYTYTDRLGYGYTGEQPPPVQSQLQLPLTRTRTASARLGLEHDLSPRSRLSLSGAWSGSSFDSEELVDGQSISAAAGYDVGAGPHGSLTVDYQFSRSDHTDAAATIHVVAAGFGWQLGPTLSTSARGGLSLTERAGDTRHWDPYASASLERTGRRSSFSASYAHSVRPSYGLGVDRATDDMGLAFRFRWRRASLLGGLGASWIHATPEDPSSIWSGSYELSFALRLGRRLALSAFHSFRWRDLPDIDARAQDLRVGVGFSFVPVGAARGH